MKIAGRGRIVIWEGGSLWVMEALPAPGGAANSTGFHAHHAVQVTFSLGGRFELRTETARLAQDAAVAPDANHIFEAVGRIAILFIEPESRQGRAVIGALFATTDLAPIAIADVAADVCAAIGDAKTDDAALEALGRALIERLAGMSAGALPDARVQKMIAHARNRLDGAITLNAAAKSAGLSPGRARHLFVEQTGLPFRTYLLWLRITKAVGLFAGGASLTEAAHEAGFADSAHFSRTFRRMFGIAAASLRID